MFGRAECTATYPRHRPITPGRAASCCRVVTDNGARLPDGSPHATVGLLGEVDHATNLFTGVHGGVGVVDFIQAITLRDQFIQLDLALFVQPQ